MLMDLTPTGSVLSVYYGTNSSKAADATKNTMWFSKPLRGIGYNIRGVWSSGGTTVPSYPSNNNTVILKSGLAGETNNYWGHNLSLEDVSKRTATDWKYGIEVMGVDGTSTFVVGVKDHPAAPSFTTLTAGSGSLTITYVANFEAASAKYYISTSAGITESNKGGGATLTASPMTISGLSAGAKYVVLTSINAIGQEGVISPEKTATVT